MGGCFAGRTRGTRHQRWCAACRGCALCSPTSRLAPAWQPAAKGKAGAGQRIGVLGTRSNVCIARGVNISSVDSATSPLPCALQSQQRLARAGLGVQHRGTGRVAWCCTAKRSGWSRLPAQEGGEMGAWTRKGAQRWRARAAAKWRQRSAKEPRARGCVAIPRVINSARTRARSSCGPGCYPHERASWRSRPLVRVTARSAAAASPCPG